MSVDCFLDTNIFIYQLEAAEDRKRQIASDLIRTGIASGNACISFQVVQEFLNTIRRKAEVPLDVEGSRRYFEAVLRPLWQVMPSAELYHRTLDIHERYRVGFYDSMIVAAAIGAGCRQLYTEDLQHGQRIESLRIENPFLA